MKEIETKIYSILRHHKLTLKKREEIIVDLLDLVKKYREEQLRLGYVVVPKGTFYCWEKDCGLEKCENICDKCNKYKGNNP